MLFNVEGLHSTRLKWLLRRYRGSRKTHVHAVLLIQMCTLTTVVHSIKESFEEYSWTVIVRIGIAIFQTLWNLHCLGASNH